MRCLTSGSRPARRRGRSRRERLSDPGSRASQRLARFNPARGTPVKLGVFGGTSRPPFTTGISIPCGRRRGGDSLEHVTFVPTDARRGRRRNAGPPGAPRRDARVGARRPSRFLPVPRRDRDAAGRPTPSRRCARSRGARPADELYFLLGTDALAGFERWREPLEILRLARLAACRPRAVRAGSAVLVNAPVRAPEFGLDFRLGPRENFVDRGTARRRPGRIDRRNHAARGGGIHRQAGPLQRPRPGGLDLPDERRGNGAGGVTAALERRPRISRSQPLGNLLVRRLLRDLFGRLRPAGACGRRLPSRRRSAAGAAGPSRSKATRRRAGSCSTTGTCCSTCSSRRRAGSTASNACGATRETRLRRFAAAR